MVKTSEDLAFHLVAAHGKVGAIADDELSNARLHARLHMTGRARHPLADLGWDENLLEWVLEHAESAPAVSEPAPAPTVPDLQPIVLPVSVPAAADARKRAAQWWAAILAFLVAVPLILGGTMLAMHGYPFFVFRQQGVGETSGNGLTENQGPGQPLAPAHGHPAIPDPGSN